uniref:Uncharacterized protein n=1 Tax=Arundo donax TaxID=35708 RepID=A0A0A9B4B4_ARUDO
MELWINCPLDFSNTFLSKDNFTDVQGYVYLSCN